MNHYNIHTNFNLIFFFNIRFASYSSGDDDEFQDTNGAETNENQSESGGSYKNLKLHLPE